MDKVQVLPGESWADVAIRRYGTLEAWAALALANGLGLTEELETGAFVQQVAFSPATASTVTVRKSAKARFVTVLPAQTLPDIAIQYLGSAAGWAEIAELNNLPLDADLEAGQTLRLPAGAQDKKLALYYKLFGYKPATVISEETLPEGIDYMGIEYDFIVK